MHTFDSRSREDGIPGNQNRGHLWKRRVVRLLDLRLNQPGLALTKRGKLEANNRRRRRKGDLILPIAGAAPVTNWVSIRVKSFKYNSDGMFFWGRKFFISAHLNDTFVATT